MIRYNPVDSDASTIPVKYLPRTCFIMCQLRKPEPDDQAEIRKRLGTFLAAMRFSEIDANSSLTGRDFLAKIWNMTFQVPIGIAIITRRTTRRSLANIFYELGLLQAYGKETLVIKSQDVRVPSDFVRTEYLEFGDDFEEGLKKFFDCVFSLQEHFDLMADQLRNDPLLAIDYLRRAFLITGEESYRAKARQLHEELRGVVRSANCVENLLVKF